MSHLIIKYSIVVLGVVITLASIDVIRLMDGGDKPCRVFKFVMAAVVGLMFSYYAAIDRGINANNPNSWVHLICAATLFLFVWPEIFFRLMQEAQRTHPLFYYRYLYRFDAYHRRKGEHADT